MSILNITPDNFNIRLSDVAKKIEVGTFHSFEGDRSRMSPGEHREHNSNAVQVDENLSEMIISAVGKINAGYPTGKQVREVLESILGIKVSCHVHKYICKEIKDTVSYDIAERGKVGADRCGVIYKERYCGTHAAITIYSIDITY